MNILVLHRNNVPVFLRQYFTLEDYYIISEPLFPSIFDKEPYDTFICNRITEILNHNKNIDLVVLPYTLSENYIEFTGLRVAAHIRLTHEWKLENIPILFIGPESDHLEDVMRYSELGDILNSYNIYNTSRKDKIDILGMFKWIQDRFRNQNQDDYNELRMNFLERLKKISIPANYASRHSIANEWAIQRWIDMFKWDKGRKPKVKSDDFQYMLYIKYLKSIEHVNICDWNNNEKKELGEENLCGRIMYIDDEGVKGWSELLNCIFSKSGVDFIEYSFNNAKEQTKDALIRNIKRFIWNDYKKNGGVSCYLVDLRLHEDDFKEGLDYRNLTGHIITSYIKKLNYGNQIVIFSASNKGWNIQESHDQNHVSGYVIKESPEQHFTNQDTKKLYCEFIGKVRRACSLSYLIDVYKSLDKFKNIGKKNKKELNLLYAYPRLVALDNGYNDNAMIKACALTQVTFLESFIKERFTWDTTTVYKNGFDWNSKFLRRIFYKGDNDNRLYYCYDPKDKNFNKPHSGQIEITYNEYADLPLVLLVLYLYYGINESNINLVARIKYERNVAIAHNNRETILTMEILKKHFDNVIMPVLGKEYNK